MRAVTRFVLDAIYIAIFFVVTLLLATGADRLVDILVAWRVDSVIVDMVRWLARGLSAFDDIGVAIAGVVSLTRFVRALLEEASNDGKSR